MVTVLNARYAKQGDECCCLSLCIEIYQISDKDKTKTLSSKYVCRGVTQ